MNSQQKIAIAFLAVLLVYALIQWPSMYVANKHAPEIRRTRVKRDYE